MAGYPGTPLPKRLGIKAGHKVCLLNAPGSVERRLGKDDLRITHDLRLPPVDVVVLFVDCLDDLERQFADIADVLHPQGGFWVAWRTRRGGGVSHEVIRRIALAAGMVDNKTCTIDASWSGLRLVLRHEIRDAMMYRALPPLPASVPRMVPPLSRRVRRPTAPAKLGRATASPASGAGSTLRRVRARSTR